MGLRFSIEDLGVGPSLKSKGLWSFKVTWARTLEGRNDHSGCS